MGWESESCSPRSLYLNVFPHPYPVHTTPYLQQRFLLTPTTLPPWTLCRYPQDESGRISSSSLSLIEPRIYLIFFSYFASPFFRPRTSPGPESHLSTELKPINPPTQPSPVLVCLEPPEARRLTSSCTKRGRVQQTTNSDLNCSVPEFSADPPHLTELYSPAGLVCIYLSHSRLSCHSLPDL